MLRVSSACVYHMLLWTQGRLSVLFCLMNYVLVVWLNCLLGLANKEKLYISLFFAMKIKFTCINTVSTLYLF